MNEMIGYIESQLSGYYHSSECRELAWWILEESTGLSRSQLLFDCKDTKNIPNLETILLRLQKKEPIEYIFGHCLWDGLDLQVNPSTLIPRPETAELCAVVARSFDHHPLRVLDIATGSGCIALSLKQQHPEWHVEGLDISAEALEVARENALRNRLDVAFWQADILAETIDDYDIIVSNPPYIREQEKASMDSHVLNYEPHLALFVPDQDPLLFYRRIASLRKATWLFFEINEALSDQMCAMMQGFGYQDILVIQDQYEKPRILSARIAQ